MEPTAEPLDVRPAEVETVDEPPRSSWRLGLIVATMVLLTMAAIAVPYLLTREDPPTTYSYVIPSGTGHRLDAGEQVIIIPSELAVHVGDSISIVNDDDRGHSVGPFYVGPGERLLHEFSEKGTIADVCTIHPSGRVTITVT